MQQVALLRKQKSEKENKLKACKVRFGMGYPNGIFWDKQIDNYRTVGENTALATIRKISTIYKNKNEKNSLENFSSVNLCG